MNFQMGGKLPPGAQEIPPIRLDLHGQFTVNLGVWVPDLHDFGSTTESDRFVNEYESHIRARLGQLLGREQDVWWPLVGHLDELGDKLRETIRTHGLPWLDEFGDNGDVLDWLETDGPTTSVRSGPSPGWSGPRPLLAAWVRTKRGEDDRARDHLISYLASDLRENHRRFVEDLVADMGFGDIL